MTEPNQQPTRSWPDGRMLEDGSCVEFSCARCRTHWRVHDRLRGFRLRCSCERWLEIPGSAAAGVPAKLTGDSGPDLPITFDAASARLDARGMVEMPGDEHDGDVIYTPIPVDAPMAPGSMRRASNRNQQRWNDRTVTEFALLMASLLLPQLGVWLFTTGNEYELLLPFASLASGVLVALIIAWAGPYGRIGFRLPRPRFFTEAVGVAALSVGVATLYVMGLEALLPDSDSGIESLVERLGFGASILVIAVAPAVLEETIFRGLLQGRLMALLGRFGGLFVTAAAFAIVHGQPAVLPIHLSLGLYLGWLRERADSLLPCILMHFLYNGTLVWLEF